MRKSVRPAFLACAIAFVTALLIATPVGLAQVSGGPNINTSKMLDDQNECAIAKNPRNKLQLFVACVTNTPDGALFGARSIDGGVTWIYPDPSKTIANGQSGLGPTPACCDPSAAWDNFGNLFITYLDSSVSYAVTLLSADDGQTFTQLAAFGPATTDQPTVTVGAGQVWVVWNQGGSIVATGAAVSGLGNIGAFIPLQHIPGTRQCNFGDIAIAPSGAVVQVCESPIVECDPLPGSLLVNIKPDGLGPNPFGPAITATATNVGGFYPIPAQDRRTTDAEAGLAFDRNPLSPHFGRLYLVYTDAPSSGSAATEIMVRFSDDNGSSWSAAIRVDDDNSGRSKFLPRIFSNPRSGNVAICWHDARNSSTNTAIEEFCSLATPQGASPTFMANARIGAALSTSTLNELQFGDYSGLVYHQGRAHPIWADSSNSTGDNPDGTSAFDGYTARVTGGAAGQENPLIATHDSDSDGLSDIAWRDNAGNVAVWLMSSAQVLASGSLGNVPTTWSIVGQRDFNGDGKYDLLWRDTSGNTAIWFLNGTQVSSSGNVGNIPATWSVISTGDFNGDGLGDILWRDSSGNLAVWLMNGANSTSTGALGNVPLVWNVVGTGDFDGDGKSDLLWRDSFGNTSIWFMNGTTVASTAGVGNIPTNWSIVGTGDFNGDGKSDIVWRDNVGNTSIWLMNGAAVLAIGSLGNVPTTWSVAQTGDYNGDGMSDLLWRDTSGNTAMWFMNGTTVASSAAVGNIPTNWTVQSVNAE